MQSKFSIYLLLTVILSGCFEDQKSVLTKETYDGPSIELEQVEILFSDSAIVKVKLTAARQLMLENDDMEFPEGIYLQFFNEKGKVTSTLKANKGYYFNLKNFYRADGDVQMNNLSSGDELTTEELFWEPDEDKLRTEKFVTIKTEDEVHNGEGLTANQDFSKYKILKPTGTITLKEKEDKAKEELILQKSKRVKRTKGN